MRPLAFAPLLFLLAFGLGCGSSAGEAPAPVAEPSASLSSAATDFNRMRDKVVLGLATDFRAGTHAGPDGFGLCVRLGMRRVLTRAQLSRLVSVYRRPGGQAFAAQALNALAAPIGAECGGAKFVPELIGAAEALGGEYPLSRLEIAARRLGIGYGPYLGVRCARPGSTHCDQVGIDVVLHREAAAVTAWVGGRRLHLQTPGLHNGVVGRDWVGYLGRVGLDRPESPFYIPLNGRNPGTWAGYPAVYVPVRLADRLPERRPGPRHGAAGLSQPGVGMRGARKAALASLLALGAIGVAGTAFGSADGSSSSRSYGSHRYGFQLELPAGWQPGAARLVPKLLDPLEILSVGTSVLPVGGGGDCDREPVAAIERMRPGDALLSVQEYTVTAAMRSRIGTGGARLASPPRSGNWSCAGRSTDLENGSPRPRTSGPRRCPSPLTAVGSTPSSTSGAGRPRRGCARCERSSRACASAAPRPARRPGARRSGAGRPGRARRAGAAAAGRARPAATRPARRRAA